MAPYPKVEHACGRYHVGCRGQALERTLDDELLGRGISTSGVTRAERPELLAAKDVGDCSPCAPRDVRLVAIGRVTVGTRSSRAPAVSSAVRRRPTAAPRHQAAASSKRARVSLHLVDQLPDLGRHRRISNLITGSQSYRRLTRGWRVVPPATPAAAARSPRRAHHP